MQLIVDIKDEKLLEKIVQLLNIFKNDGVEIVNYSTEKNSIEQDSKNHIPDDWKEIVMNTHSADRDDDEFLYDAAWEFYNEKHSH